MYTFYCYRSHEITYDMSPHLFEFMQRKFDIYEMCYFEKGEVHFMHNHYLMKVRSDDISFIYKMEDLVISKVSVYYQSPIDVITKLCIAYFPEYMPRLYMFRSF